jgi:hypothetical protein
MGGEQSFMAECANNRSAPIQVIQQILGGGPKRTLRQARQVTQRVDLGISPSGPAVAEPDILFVAGVAVIGRFGLGNRHI